MFNFFKKTQDLGKELIQAIEVSKQEKLKRTEKLLKVLQQYIISKVKEGNDKFVLLGTPIYCSPIDEAAYLLATSPRFREALFDWAQERNLKIIIHQKSNNTFMTIHLKPLHDNLSNQS